MKKLAQQQIESMGVDKLEEEIRHHNHLYFELQKPEISDEDFDRLVIHLKKLKPNSEVLTEIGSDIRKGVVVPKIPHTEPMLSLDKCYNLEDLIDWGNKFEGDVIVSPKIDGCAVEIRYDNDGKISLAATRGDGFKGEDITANVRYVTDLPKKISQGPLEVRGEVYMPLSVFKKFKEQFANPRNLAAGAIKQKQPQKTAEYHLRFFAYDLLSPSPLGGERAGVRGELGEAITLHSAKTFKSASEKIDLLKKLGFKAVETKTITKSEKEMQSEWEKYLSIRDQLDYEIDGVVYKANLISEQERLGASAHHPRFSIAYKFQGDSGITTLREVEWSVARTGVITPMGIVDPVELSGAMVSRVSLHNHGMVKKLGITVPAKVMMMRRGGVIPHLESILEGNGKPVKIPKECPSCGFPTEVKEDFLYCTNKKNCQKIKTSELNHFVKTVEIDGFGDKLIERLYSEGYVEDAADFYTLTKDDLLTIERMGEKLATKLIGNIQSKREIPLDLFLQSLGIRELAKHSSKILVKEFGSLKNILQVTEEELSSIHTIGPVIAREVVEGFQKKKELIQKLLKQVHPIESIILKKGIFSGKTFLFTGKMASMERSDAEKKVEELGGEISSGVTKDLNYLVIGSEGYKNREKGNKWIKAEKLMEKGERVQIISEEEFLNMANL